MHQAEIESFRTETIVAHNQYRAEHGTTPLSLSFQLCDSAQKWAEHLIKSDKFERSPQNDNYNENIACTWGSHLTGTLVSRMWYEEGKDYDYTRDTLSKSSQNFTQLLWKSSREMGVGRARTKHGKEVIVARYHPPGNNGEFTENVLKKSELTESSTVVVDTITLNRIPGLRQFQEDCLLAHNKYRQRHGAPPLQWSYKLAYEAQKWAQHLLDSGQFKHGENVVYGENLAGRRRHDLNGKKAAKLWYDESKLFHFEEPSFSPDTGNFTQLIWRGSRYFGVGKAFNGDMCMVVAYYFPPGNIVEEFKENVWMIVDNVDGDVINETRKPTGVIAKYGQYELDKFRTEFLVFVNYLRARHACPPLTTSHLLMNNAQNWANELLRSGRITYSSDENTGESIAYAEREDLTAFKVSHTWYREIQNHNFSNTNPNPETLNFTQMVWHDSRELGVGKAVGKDGFSVVVAQYSPPGNRQGKVKENVRKLCRLDLNEIAYMKKGRLDENANVVEDKQKNGFSGIILPSRNEETYVFRPPSGEFNQLVWIDRSSTPCEGTQQPEMSGDATVKEDTPEHEFESPPPSPSRAVDQIEKLLTGTRQTWETESSGEEDLDEETEHRKPDVEEYVVLSKSTSREDIGSEEGSVYKRLSRTFSDEMEYSRQQSVPEDEELPNTTSEPYELKGTQEIESELVKVVDDSQQEKLQNGERLQSPLVLRKSQQYVHHYDQEFGQVKEASIVTRPGVSEAEETQDWEVIEDILHSPRPLRLSQNMEDANIPSPEYDGQRAVLRRINNEDNATVPASYEDKNTSDTSLPVLEHVVTTSFARTVDHSAVDEKIENLFSACNMEDDQGDETKSSNSPSVSSELEPPQLVEDDKYDENEFLLKQNKKDKSTELNPIEHVSICKETKEYSYSVSDDVFDIEQEYPANKVLIQKDQDEEETADKRDETPKKDEETEPILTLELSHEVEADLPYDQRREQFRLQGETEEIEGDKEVEESRLLVENTTQGHEDTEEQTVEELEEMTDTDKETELQVSEPVISHVSFYEVKADLPYDQQREQLRLQDETEENEGDKNVEESRLLEEDTTQDNEGSEEQIVEDPEKITDKEEGTVVEVSEPLISLESSHEVETNLPYDQRQEQLRLQDEIDENEGDEDDEKSIDTIQDNEGIEELTVEERQEITDEGAELKVSEPVISLESSYEVEADLPYDQQREQLRLQGDKDENEGDEDVEVSRLLVEDTAQDNEGIEELTVEERKEITDEGSAVQASEPVISLESSYDVEADLPYEQREEQLRLQDETEENKGNEEIEESRLLVEDAAQDNEDIEEQNVKKAQEITDKDKETAFQVSETVISLESSYEVEADLPYDQRREQLRRQDETEENEGNDEDEESILFVEDTAQDNEGSEELTVEKGQEITDEGSAALVSESVISHESSYEVETDLPCDQRREQLKLQGETEENEGHEEIGESTLLVEDIAQGNKGIEEREEITDEDEQTVAQVSEPVFSLESSYEVEADLPYDHGIEQLRLQDEIEENEGDEEVEESRLLVEDTAQDNEGIEEQNVDERVEITDEDEQTVARVSEPVFSVESSYEVETDFSYEQRQEQLRQQDEIEENEEDEDVQKPEVLADDITQDNEVIEEQTVDEIDEVSEEGLTEDVMFEQQIAVASTEAFREEPALDLDVAEDRDKTIEETRYSLEQEIYEEHTTNYTIETTERESEAVYPDQGELEETDRQQGTVAEGTEIQTESVCTLDSSSTVETALSYDQQDEQPRFEDETEAIQGDEAVEESKLLAEDTVRDNEEEMVDKVEEESEKDVGFTDSVKLEQETVIISEQTLNDEPEKEQEEGIIDEAKDFSEQELFVEEITSYKVEETVEAVGEVKSVDEKVDQEEEELNIKETDQEESESQTEVGTPFESSHDIDDQEEEREELRLKDEMDESEDDQEVEESRLFIEDTTQNNEDNEDQTVDERVVPEEGLTKDETLEQQMTITNEDTLQRESALELAETEEGITEEKQEFSEQLRLEEETTSYKVETVEVVDEVKNVEEQMDQEETALEGTLLEEPELQIEEGASLEISHDIDVESSDGQEGDSKEQLRLKDETEEGASDQEVLTESTAQDSEGSEGQTVDEREEIKYKDEGFTENVRLEQEIAISSEQTLFEEPETTRDDKEEGELQGITDETDEQQTFDDEITNYKIESVEKADELVNQKETELEDADVPPSTENEEPETVTETLDASFVIDKGFSDDQKREKEEPVSLEDESRQNEGEQSNDESNLLITEVVQDIEGNEDEKINEKDEIMDEEGLTEDTMLEQQISVTSKVTLHEEPALDLSVEDDGQGAAEEIEKLSEQQTVEEEFTIETAGNEETRLDDATAAEVPEAEEETETDTRASFESYHDIEREETQNLKDEGEVSVDDEKDEESRLFEVETTRVIEGIKDEVVDEREGISEEGLTENVMLDQQEDMSIEQTLQEEPALDVAEEDGEGITEENQDLLERQTFEEQEVESIDEPVHREAEELQNADIQQEVLAPEGETPSTAPVESSDDIHADFPERGEQLKAQDETEDHDMEDIVHKMKPETTEDDESLTENKNLEEQPVTIGEDTLKDDQLQDKTIEEDNKEIIEETDALLEQNNLEEESASYHIETADISTEEEAVDDAIYQEETEVKDMDAQQGILGDRQETETEREIQPAGNLVVESAYEQEGELFKVEDVIDEKESEKLIEEPMPSETDLADDQTIDSNGEEADNTKEQMTETVILDQPLDKDVPEVEVEVEVEQTRESSEHKALEESSIVEEDDATYYEGKDDLETEIKAEPVDTFQKSDDEDLPYDQDDQLRQEDEANENNEEEIVNLTDQVRDDDENVFMEQETEKFDEDPDKVEDKQEIEEIPDLLEQSGHEETAELKEVDEIIDDEVIEIKETNDDTVTDESDIQTEVRPPLESSYEKDTILEDSQEQQKEEELGMSDETEENEGDRNVEESILLEEDAEKEVCIEASQEAIIDEKEVPIEQDKGVVEDVAYEKALSSSEETLPEKLEKPKEDDEEGLIYTKQDLIEQSEFEEETRPDEEEEGYLNDEFENKEIEQGTEVERSEMQTQTKERSESPSEFSEDKNVDEKEQLKQKDETDEHEAQESMPFGADSGDHHPVQEFEKEIIGNVEQRTEEDKTSTGDAAVEEQPDITCSDDDSDLQVAQDGQEIAEESQDLSEQEKLEKQLERTSLVEEGEELESAEEPKFEEVIDIENKEETQEPVTQFELDLPRDQETPEELLEDDRQNEGEGKVDESLVFCQVSEEERTFFEDKKTTYEGEITLEKDEEAMVEEQPLIAHEGLQEDLEVAVKEQSFAEKSQEIIEQDSLEQEMHPNEESDKVDSDQEAVMERGPDTEECTPSEVQSTYNIDEDETGNEEDRNVEELMISHDDTQEQQKIQTIAFDKVSTDEIIQQNKQDQGVPDDGELEEELSTTVGITLDEETSLDKEVVVQEQTMIEEAQEYLDQQESEEVPETETDEIFSEEGRGRTSSQEEQSPKHVRFSTSCEIFEEESMAVLDTEEVDDNIEGDDDVYTNQEDSVEDQEVDQADKSEADNEARWVELERNPVVWQTVEEVFVDPQTESKEQEHVLQPTADTNEAAGENEKVPELVINLGAHAIVEDAIKQALAQSEEQSDGPFTPRLVRTESGNMVIVKLDEAGALEERYELMEFELYEQYMKEKGTFSPFQSEFPCDVDKVFTSNEGDKQFARAEELEYVGDDDDVDYAPERPILESQLSIIMEEPPSRSESLSESLVQANEAAPSNVEVAKEEHATSPGEYDIVDSVVQKIQHETANADENTSVASVPTTEDEFMVLWRSQEKVCEQNVKDDENPVESSSLTEQELTEAIAPDGNEKMEYLNLEFRESPDVHSESSLSPGGSVRSWVSSDLSSLDDETTSKRHKSNKDGNTDVTTVQEAETLELQSADDELSSEKLAQTYEDQVVGEDSQGNTDSPREPVTSAQLHHLSEPSESSTKDVSINTEQDGDKKITQIVTTEVTRKLVKIIDGKEVPMDDKDIEEYERTLGDMMGREGTLEQPVIVSEEHEDDGITRTTTTVVTCEGEAVSSEEADDMLKKILGQFETKEFHSEPEVVTEEREGEVKRTITRTVTRKVEMSSSTAYEGEKFEELEGKDQGEELDDITPKEDEHEITDDKTVELQLESTEHQHELLDDGEINIERPNEEKVSYEVIKDDDGTITKITTVETFSSTFEPRERPEVVKSMLEESGEMFVESAPNVEYEEHGDDHVVTQIKREVREVTTMESKTELGDFQARVLLEHNKCRYIHYSQPLTWSDELAKEAQIWAQHLAESGCLKHSSSSEYGENVAYSSEVLNGYDLSQLWYDEIKHYSFIKPGFTTQTAHFTQLVWAGSKEMGVGMAIAPDGTSYYVARYNPPGNKLGCFEENVLSPRECGVEGRPRKKKSPSPPSPPNEIETIKHDCLVTHNYHRFQHGAPELIWSPILSVEALHRAEGVIRSGSVEASDTHDHGENIAISSDRSFDVKAAIELWYKEEKDYDYDSPAFSSLTRNFSQMIWRECKEVGMALSRSDDGELVVVVARYSPVGNVVGMFQDNVLPAS